MLRLLEWLPWTPSGIYAIGVLLSGARRAHGWVAVAITTRMALGASLTSGAAAAYVSGGSQHYAGSAAAPVVTALIAFLGWVIGDYSGRYLRGEPGQSRFIVAFLATLASVTAVVASTNLGVLILAWAASSAGLHHLLTFYPQRPAAIIVAHKKFLASRFAEGLLAAAAALMYLQWNTLDIATIATQAQSLTALPWRASAATVLIAAAVLVKCAQLPLHGWLIQVMEAPTPVSALLHAGVVNLGGYVLIRLAPLIGASLAAQTLLVVVGSLTAAIAGLVMLTRITIKVRLAWSTCSQMGFMVMECGLGLYDLALLHLVAHSLYKAHAFLTAGDAVRDGIARQMIARRRDDVRRHALVWPVLALPLAAGVTTGSAALWHTALGLPQVPWIATTLLAVGLATLLWAPGAGRQPNWTNAFGLVAVAQIYLALHLMLAGWLGIATIQPPFILAAWSLLVFATLYAAQLVVSARRLDAPDDLFYDWIYAGLYLEERFTRLTFRLWPARPGQLVPDAFRDSNLDQPEGTT